ncbi:Cholesterol 24-hydroxylase [Holothuria leucospilota]|uniref:Cholesterol 24-hydroxylase n=1 Tax=Holothuria leucospilota TaxID=206669 RepID=A0A9Q1CJC3_HOLLE|nr:Cholesterol 24-hydroxylase [Holothuria leucospilota]
MFVLILLQYILVLLVLVVAGFAFIYVAYIKYIHFKFSHIPGPKRESFIVGHTFIAKIVAERTSSLAETFLELHYKYGKVFVVFYLHMPFIAVADPAVVKRIMLDNKYLKPASNYQTFQSIFGQRFMGKGLVSETDHERWALHRRVFNPAFHRKYLMELTGTFNESADRLVKYLSAKADGKTEVKVMGAFERVTLDIICKVGFAMEGDMIFSDTPFSDAIKTGLGAMYTASSPWIQMDPRKEARDYRKKVIKAITLLRDTGVKVITDRFEAMKQEKELPKDILSYVIKSAVVEENLSMEEMVDHFLTFFVAGQETTSDLLSFVLICLGKNPHVLKKLLEEVDTVIGDKEVIEYDDIIKLEYMMLVIKETLRLYPPVTGGVRLISEDVDILGYKIPAGCSLFMMGYGMSRMEEYFKDALIFNPDRFKEEDPQRMYATFPFSLGARSCIGQQFALIEARIILCKILQKFNFQLVPDQSFGIFDELTIKPIGGCANYISFREK